MVDTIDADVDAEMTKYMMEILSIIYQQAEKRTDLLNIGAYLGVSEFQNLLTNAGVAINKDDTGLEPKLCMAFLHISRHVAMRSPWNFNKQEEKDLIKKIFEGNKTERIISTMNNMEIVFVLCEICLKAEDYFLNKNLENLS